METCSRASVAHDLRVSNSADRARDFVNDDGDVCRSGTEAGSSEGDVFSAHNVSVSRHDALQERSQGAVISNGIQVRGGSIGVQFGSTWISRV